jgi:hypothetical protein
MTKYVENTDGSTGHLAFAGISANGSVADPAGSITCSSTISSTITCLAASSAGRSVDALTDIGARAQYRVVITSG